MATPAVSNTFVGMQRTVVWDIRSPYPQRGRVPVPDWLDFLEKDVGLDLARDVSAAAIHTITGDLLTVINDDEVFQRVKRKAEEGVQWRRYDVNVYGWAAGEEAIKVHLHNGFQQSSVDAAVKEITKHGKVIHQKVHYYSKSSKIRNGIVSLTVKLKAEAELPTYIYDEETDNTIQVQSDRHDRTCWRCLGKGHVAVFCKKPVQTRLNAAKTKTWATVAKTAPTPRATPPQKQGEQSQPTPSVPQTQVEQKGNEPGNDNDQETAQTLPNTPEKTTQPHRRTLTPKKVVMNRRMSVPPSSSPTKRRYEERVGRDLSPELLKELEDKKQRVRLYATTYDPHTHTHQT